MQFLGPTLSCSGSGSFGGALSASGGFQTTQANALRIVNGNYGSFWRMDGANLYLLITASGDQYGGWNTLRPYQVNVSTGYTIIGNGLQVIGGATFDAFSASGTSVVNTNAAAAPTPNNGSVLQLSGVDGSTTRVTVDAYGGTGNLTFRACAGTNAAKSAVGLGFLLGTTTFFGYGATGYSSSSRAAYSGYASETWTDTAQGSYLALFTTKTGTTTQAVALRVENDGNLNQGNGTTSWAQAGRNLLINGSFRINQRGYASGATLSAGVYGHDRWKMNAPSGNYTFSQAPQSNVNSTAAAIDTQVTIPSGSILVQYVEANAIDGTPLTLSWSGTALAGVKWYDGTSDHVFADPVSSPYTFTPPVGVTLQVYFYNGTLSKAQLERGQVATPFEREPYQATLDKCQRYYEVISYDIWSGSITSGSTYYKTLPMKVNKRAIPTLTVQSSSANGFGSITVFSLGADAVTVQATANATGASSFFAGSYAISSEL